MLLGMRAVAEVSASPVTGLKKVDITLNFGRKPVSTTEDKRSRSLELKVMIKAKLKALLKYILTKEQEETVYKVTAVTRKLQSHRNPEGGRGRCFLCLF